MIYRAATHTHTHWPKGLMHFYGISVIGVILYGLILDKML